MSNRTNLNSEIKFDEGEKGYEDIQFYSAYARTDINKPFEKFELKEDKINIHEDESIECVYSHSLLLRGKALFLLVEKMDTNLIRKLN